MIKQLLTTLATTLDASEVPYMVIGGQAVLRYGRRRVTDDIDITLGVAVADVKDVKRFLRHLDLEPRRADFDAVLRQGMLACCRYRTLPISIDLAFSSVPYDLQAIERAQAVDIEGVPVRFASAEDLVVQKVVAGRPVDHADVVSVLFMQAGIDLNYIRYWLDQFAQVLEEPLVERFEQLLREAKE